MNNVQIWVILDNIQNWNFPRLLKEGSLYPDVCIVELLGPDDNFIIGDMELWGTFLHRVESYVFWP